MLADAARFVKPGGILVYVTCSLLPLENGGKGRRIPARGIQTSLALGVRRGVERSACQVSTVR